jgi:hypothetical protein
MQRHRRSGLDGHRIPLNILVCIIYVREICKNNNIGLLCSARLAEVRTWRGSSGRNPMAGISAYLLTQCVENIPRPAGIILWLSIVLHLRLCWVAWVDADQEPVIDVEENVKVLDARLNTIGNGRSVFVPPLPGKQRVCLEYQDGSCLTWKRRTRFNTM